MKKEKNKHDHSATKCLKVALFTILMLLPLIYIAFQCLPYTFNDSTTIPETTSIFDTASNLLLNSDLMTWTTNTLLYTGVNAMFTQLNINSNLIIELLTYWLMLTSIYVIIDIVLEMFIYLTHWINDRAV